MVLPFLFWGNYETPKKNGGCHGYFGIILVGGGNAWCATTARAEPTTSLPTNTLNNSFDTVGTAIYYSDDVDYYLARYIGDNTTELILSSEMTMTSDASSSDAGWSGAYKSFTNNGTLKTNGKVGHSGFLNSTVFDNNSSVITTAGSTRNSHGYSNTGTFTNESKGTLQINGDGAAGAMGFSNDGNLINKGSISAAGRSSVGLYHGSEQTFTNYGTVSSVCETSDGTINHGTINNEVGATYRARTLQATDSYGVENRGTFNNAGTLEVSRASGNSDIYGFYNHRNGTLDNSGVIDASGLKNDGDVTNNSGGIINASGGNEKDYIGWNGKLFENSGNFDATGGSASGAHGAYLTEEVTNYASMTFTGGSNSSAYGAVIVGYLRSYEDAAISVFGSESSIAQGLKIGTANDEAELMNLGVINANGRKGSALYLVNGTIDNEEYGTVNLNGGDGAGAFIYKGEFINKGTVNLSATVANKAIKLGTNGTYSQTVDKAVTNGNLLSFMDYAYSGDDSSSGTVKYINADGQLVSTDAFAEATGEGGFTVGTLASFLTSNISAGTLTITDTDWSADVQAKIKEAIYGAGVGSNVNITFGGTGTKGETATKFSLTKFMENVVSGTLFPELVIESTQTTPLDVLVLSGNDDSLVSEQKTIKTFEKSFGVKGFEGVSQLGLEKGASLQVLGDGNELFKNPETVFSAKIDNQSLLILGSDNSNITSKQGGTLTGQVSLAGRLQIAAVADKYSLSDLRLSETAQVTNAGHINVEQLAFNTRTATVMNSGVMRVAAVTASQVGSTLKNTGVYSQTDLSAFGDIQNKGTLKTGTLTVGAADKLINGGTILAEKITIDGLLQNRNGTFALGTAAVAKYLEKHLDLAQQLKDLGETLPTSVENLLAAQADAEVASLTTLELADGERSVASDEEMSEKPEGTDFVSWFAAMQAANAPQGRLVTREGRLAFAGLTSHAENRAQVERQLASGVSGLWADVIASQSEMDGYKANRSGIAVGLQGTNDTGLTFGVSARYSDGKLKGDTLASENWTSVGGSAYAAWNNDDAFVSGFVGYDNLKTKGSDKLTNDVVSAGVKSGLKLDAGSVHVTPFVGGEVVHQKVKGLDAATTYRFPMGVGLSGQYETYGAWQVHPSLEVAFVPKAGDKVLDVTDQMDSRFAGNYAVESRLGIAVEKKNLMLGINYHGSAGDAGLRSHSLQANVKYRF